MVIEAGSSESGIKNKDEKSSFKELSKSMKIVVVLSVLTLVIVSVSLVFGGFFFGLVGFFKVFGVQYESVSSLILFVLCYFFIGFIADLFSMALIRLASESLTGKHALFFMRMTIDCAFSWFVMFTKVNNLSSHIARSSGGEWEQTAYEASLIEGGQTYQIRMEGIYHYNGLSTEKAFTIEFDCDSSGRIQ